MPGLDESRFQTRQVFYTSKDGTFIPMFIIHKKVRTAGKTSKFLTKLSTCKIHSEAVALGRYNETVSDIDIPVS